MNDHAYDISHLLALESAAAPAPVAPVRKLTTVRTASPLASAATVQNVLEQELLQSAAAHEDFIRDYLRSRGEPVSEPREH